MVNATRTLLDVRHAAAFLAVSVRTLRKLLAARTLPWFKIVGCVRVDQADLDAFLNKCRRALL
jgi:excisionase family DNA binding protein